MRLELKDSLELAKSLGLPDIVQRILNGESLPFELSTYFGCAGEFFCLTADEQAYFTKGKFIPLWCNGNFDDMAAYDTVNSSYVRFDVEEPDEGQMKPLTYEQLMATEFKRLWEAEKAEVELKEIAALFKFTGIEQFLAVFAKIDKLPYVQYNDEFEKFRATIYA